MFDLQLLQEFLAFGAIASFGTICSFGTFDGSLFAGQDFRDEQHRIGTGGAMTSVENKQALFELLPDVMIVDGYGASETGGISVQATTLIFGAGLSVAADSAVGAGLAAGVAIALGSLRIRQSALPRSATNPLGHGEMESQASN